MQKKTTPLLLILLLINGCSHQKVQSMTEIAGTVLSVSGTKIIDGSGKQVNLLGCNLGNWLVLEMWMLDHHHSGIRDQWEFEGLLEKRFGKAEKDELMEVYRSNWITEKDFEIVRSFGFNTIRLPFEYKLLMDDDHPFELKQNAWKWLDHAVDLAKKYGLYVILDLHGAPGRQSGMDHTGRVDHNKLWTEEKYQDQTIWLWEEISKHYKNNPVVAAYDLLNEPWGGSKEELRDLIYRLTAAIRNLDDEHIVIFPGHYEGIDFYHEVPPINESNFIYTMHFYPGFFGWGAPVPQVHADFLQNGLQDWKDKMDRFDVPLLVGEFNVVSKRAGGGEMMRRYYDRYQKWGWPATMWSYQVFTRQGGDNEMNWGMVSNSQPLVDLDIAKNSMDEIRDWFKSLSTIEKLINKDLQHWLTTSEKPSTLDDLPPLPPPVTQAAGFDPLPGNWQAVDIGGALKGGQVITENNWEIFGGGNDIWNNEDQFRYVWMPWTGDFTFEVTVDEILNTHSYAKAGLMVRKTLEPGSEQVIINFFPYGNTEFGYRREFEKQMVASSGISATLPGGRLQLKRIGDKFIGSVMLNGEWNKIGEVTIESIGAEILIGLATLSHDNTQLTRAVYSNLNLVN